MKAQTLLAKSQTVAQRAESFVTTIKRNIQKDVLDVLTSKREKLEDELFELQDFTLETNLNSGKAAMARESVQKSFERMIEIEYEKELLDAEIASKTKAFNLYFEEAEAIKEEV